MTADEFKAEAAKIRNAAMASAMRYVGNTDVAEDIVQDTMLKMWSMCPALKKPAGPLATVLIRNACIDHLRRHRQHCSIENMCIEEPVQGDADTVRMARMMEIVDRLPDTQQVILRLRHMQGMEMREIADITGMSEVNIRKVLSRARQSVRDKFMKGDKG